MIQMESMPLNVFFRDTHHLKLLFRISNLNYLPAHGKLIGNKHHIVRFLFPFEDKNM